MRNASFSRAAKAVNVSQGPDANFGLATPTPGFGAEWTRNKFVFASLNVHGTYIFSFLLAWSFSWRKVCFFRETELDTQKHDSELQYLEKFDRYAAPRR